MNIPAINPKATRLKLRMNQTDFWKPIGVTQSGGSRYEAENRTMPKAVRIVLAITYGTPAQSSAVVASLRGE